MEEQETDVEYLKKFGIDYSNITHTYIVILMRMHKFIEKMNFQEYVNVDTQALRRATMDCFADIVRIKEYHPIDEISTEKFYAYTAYWLLRRKPIQIIKPYKKCEFVNEFFLANIIASSILIEKKIDNDKISSNASFNEFRSLLFYNLKYRPVFQQTLELAIKAFFSGFDSAV